MSECGSLPAPCLYGVSAEIVGSSPPPGLLEPAPGNLELSFKRLRVGPPFPGQYGLCPVLIRIDPCRTWGNLPLRSPGVALGNV